MDISPYDAGTVACLNYSLCKVNDENPIQSQIKELSEIIQSKCGQEPYRIYLSQKIHKLLMIENHDFGQWETHIENSLKDTIILFANNSYKGIARLTIYNAKDFEYINYE